MARLISDIDLEQSKRFMEVLMQEVPLFQDINAVQLEEMFNILKFLTVKK